MALKALMLRKRLEEAQKNVDVLMGKNADFESREADLESAINEIDADAEDAEEQRTAVTEAVETFEAERDAHMKALDEAKEALDSIRTELEAIEAEQPVSTDTKTEITRKDTPSMNMNCRFDEMTYEQRQAFCERDDVRRYLNAVRTNAYNSSNINTEKDIDGAALTVPDVMLELVRRNIPEYSKLYKHVRVRKVGGTARMNITGDIPEAVWTEQIAKINEVTIGFTQIEVDGYKLGAFINISNATLEDADYPALAAEIIFNLSRALGLALDKAIIAGTGTKMPTGITTNLDSTLQFGIDGTGIDLFKALVKDTALLDAHYATGGKVWCMNAKTYADLVAEAMSINATGAIVTGMSTTMPVVGGQVEILEFLPDDYIFVGYFEDYLLAERAGMRTARDDSLGFIEDTVYYRITARYDGKPIIAKAFAGIQLGAASFTAPTLTFAEDTANANG